MILLDGGVLGMAMHILASLALAGPSAGFLGKRVLRISEGFRFPGYQALQEWSFRTLTHNPSDRIRVPNARPLWRP
jgi:hypothetical protein